MTTSSVTARLCLLGGFELSWAGEPLHLSLAGQRVLALLAVGQQRRTASRQALAERLWPDAPGERAASNLRSALWRLPRPRGRALVVAHPATVQLADDLAVDLWEAEDVAERALAEDAAALDAAVDLAQLALLRRDLLPSWHDEWLQVEQESFRQKRVHALERGAAVLCRRGRHTDALTAALAAVQCEPLRESAHRSVIGVHLAEGNHAEALRQYHHYRRLLHDELGLPPSPAMRELVSPLLGRPADRRRRRRETA